MKHLIVVGACYLDTILKNVLEQLLADHDAIQLHLVSPLPSASSSATRRVVSSFGSQSNIDFSHCIYREVSTEAASSYIIRSEESGSRTLVNYNDLPEMTEEEFGNIARSFEPDQETWWHFEVGSMSGHRFCLETLD
ncbi:hypothetical protein NW762_011761 [Fusarium torreyae]|uniref:Uncharacterized protein n=1 Tax=Fusarium torreyae TaxID=1237075 RepID=A0A9W8RQ26_9HYPO|nr:hypothetical protein NW762_011761 [Fusarium torreyae]